MKPFILTVVLAAGWSLGQEILSNASPNIELRDRLQHAAMMDRPASNWNPLGFLTAIKPEDNTGEVLVVLWDLVHSSDHQVADWSADVLVFIVAGRFDLAGPHTARASVKRDVEDFLFQTYLKAPTENDKFMASQLIRRSGDKRVEKFADEKGIPDSETLSKEAQRRNQK